MNNENNKNDDVEVLKKRVDDIEAKIGDQRRTIDNSNLANLITSMIGLVIVAVGIYFIISNDLYAGLIIILIGVQFLT